MFTQDTGGDAGPAKRHASVPLIRRGPLLTFMALALAVAVTATVARWPAHAADLVTRGRRRMESGPGHVSV